MVMLAFFVENELDNKCERLYVFVLIMHCMCVISVYDDTLERVGVHAGMF